MAEDIDDKNKKESNKAFGPSKASLKAQQEYFDRAVDLNDQLRFQISNLNEKTVIDKEQLKISNQLVQSVKRLKGEYLDQKDLSKEISKTEASKAAQQKIQNNLSQQFTKDERQRMQLAMNMEKGIQNQKKELAQIISQDAKGLAIDEERKAELEARISSQQKSLATRMKNFSVEQKQFIIGQKNLKLTEEILEALEEEEASLERINNAMGISGGALKSINELFGFSKSTTDKILANTTKRLKILEEEGEITGKNSDKLIGLKIISEEVGKAISKNMLDPIALIGLALNYSKQINEFQKGLGVSYMEAAALRGEVTSVAAASGNMAINSKNIQETFMSLNVEFGTASTTLATMFPEVLTQATQLQSLMGLSAKSTADFASAAIRTGKPLKDIKEDAIGAVVAAEAETGARLNIKEVLDSIGEVSGQVRAQLAANPEAIMKAVAVAKQFGMELKDIEKTSKSLLQFESSIEAELKAELLTGKQLNLERARLAALTGDYETLSREINKNVGDFSDFSQMNVLQQDALAASLGMTSDELSDQLLKKADLAALSQEARASGNEELAQQLEARSAQEKFKDVITKIQTIFADLVGGPLAGFIDLLGSALNILSPVFKIVGAIASTIAKITSFDFENMNMFQKTVTAIAAGLLAIKGVQMAIIAKQRISYELGFAKLLLEERVEFIKNKQFLTGKKMGLLEKAAIILGFKRVGAEAAVNTAKKTGNRLSLVGMLREAGKFVFKMFSSLGFPLNLIVGAIGAGIAATLISRYSKGDDVISPGYGKRTLMMPEGAIALNDKDTVIAGTNLRKGDDVISAPEGTISAAPAIDYDKMAAAMSSVQVQSQISYDPFAARNSQGGVFYGNQAKQNKMN